ncbi:MAG TPA: ATP-binding cassette domain-containing protein [Anaerolineales bacterium]|nr:ATP-binding cassette domain-containing protein [Anaerolineales bacterium]
MQVDIRDIRKYFGPVKANDGITIKLEGGHIYGLLGENGAGKSTLMKILSGYQPPDSGEILFDGKSHTFDSPRSALENGVGMLYQEPHDIPPFKIIDNYLLGKDSQVNLNYRRAEKELNELSSRYGFELDLEAYVDTLSLGERQQLELVRLLAGGAEVLILDEPTTGISAEQKDVLFATMRKLAHEEGKILILVSHKLAEIQDLCDHAFVLRRGKYVGELNIPCPNEELVEMMFGQVPPRSERPPFELGQPILEVRDLTISTYRMTMENLNFSVKAGEIFGLAGLDGSGQLLLMQACAGLVRPSSGQIILDGEDVASWPYHKTRMNDVAYVAAGRLEEGLVAGLSLTEHTVLSQKEQDFFVNWAEADEVMKERIKHYQIVGRPDSTADELSGGNQQRLLFSLLWDKLKLIMLEHPTRGLDVRSTNYIWDLFYKRRDDDTAIMFISPDLDEIIERSDRIAVFSGGKMSRIVDAKETSVEELGHLIGGQL